MKYLTYVALVLTICWLLFHADEYAKKNASTSSLVAADGSETSKNTNNSDSSIDLITPKPTKWIGITDNRVTNSAHESEFSTLFEDYLLAKHCDLLSRRLNYYFIQSQHHPAKQLAAHQIFEAHDVRYPVWMEASKQCGELASRYDALWAQPARLQKHDYDLYPLYMAMALERVVLKTEATTEKDQLNLKTLKQINRLKDLISIHNVAEVLEHEDVETKLADAREELRQLQLEYQQAVNQSGATAAAKIFPYYHSAVDQFERFIAEAENYISGQDDQHNELVQTQIKTILANLNQTTAEGMGLIFQMFDQDLKIERMEQDDLFPSAIWTHLFAKHLFVYSSINDLDYYNHLVGPSFDMFLCVRGLDCSKSSYLVRSYCFGLGRHSRLDQACQSNFVEIYERHLMSKNQQEDAAVFIQSLMNQYET